MVYYGYGKSEKETVISFIVRDGFKRVDLHDVKTGGLVTISSGSGEIQRAPKIIHRVQSSLPPQKME